MSAKRQHGGECGCRNREREGKRRKKIEERRCGE